jgi:hypothetical protein
VGFVEDKVALTGVAVLPIPHVRVSPSLLRGAHGGAVSLRHCTTSRKAAGSIPAGVRDFLQIKRKRITSVKHNSLLIVFIKTL